MDFDIHTLPEPPTVRDLNVAAAYPLRSFGYEICGDDDGGWYWTLGRHDSRCRALVFDHLEQAIYAAMLDLAEHTHELLQAASRVVVNPGAQPSVMQDLRTAVTAMARGLPTAG